MTWFPNKTCWRWRSWILISKGGMLNVCLLPGLCNISTNLTVWKLRSYELCRLLGVRPHMSRTYFHTISVSNNWVVFSALRILSTEIARKFWRIERTIRTCFCIQFIWRISCDPLYLQLFRCWIPSGSHLVHILDKLMNVLVCVIRAKHRIWSLKKFAHSSGSS